MINPPQWISDREEELCTSLCDHLLQNDEEGKDENIVLVLEQAMKDMARCLPPTVFKAATNVRTTDCDDEKELDGCQRNFIRGVVAKATLRYEATKSSLKNCSMTNNSDIQKNAKKPKQQNSFSLFDLLDQQAGDAQQHDVIPEIFRMVEGLNYSIELCADLIELVEKMTIDEFVRICNRDEALLQESDETFRLINHSNSSSPVIKLLNCIDRGLFFLATYTREDDERKILSLASRYIQFYWGFFLDLISEHLRMRSFEFEDAPKEVCFRLVMFTISVIKEHFRSRLFVYHRKCDGVQMNIEEANSVYIGHQKLSFARMIIVFFNSLLQEISKLSMGNVISQHRIEILLTNLFSVIFMDVTPINRVEDADSAVTHYMCPLSLLSLLDTNARWFTTWARHTNSQVLLKLIHETDNFFDNSQRENFKTGAVVIDIRCKNGFDVSMIEKSTRNVKSSILKITIAVCGRHFPLDKFQEASK